MHEERMRRAREAFELAEAERRERGEPAWGPAGAAVRAELALRDGASPGSSPGSVPPRDERSPFGLPDLAQVTGWSKADPKKVPHHPDVALFGGWRIEDMEESPREGVTKGIVLR